MWGGRRSYYRDSYGRVREDRQAQQRRPGMPGHGKWALIVLLVLAAIMVVASLMQSSYHAVVRGIQGPDQISSSISAPSISAAGSGAVPRGS